MSDFYQLSVADQEHRLTGLANVALTRWEGRFREVALFKNRENAVFSVYRDDGTRLALRIHRAAYHGDAALRSELYWMAELARAGVDVPPVIPAADGSLLVHVGAPGVPEVRQVDMLGWLPGSGSDVSDTGFYRRLGELAARLHDKGSDIHLPEDFDRHSWDEEGLLGPYPIWGRFWDLPRLSADQRTLLLAARDRARRDLAVFGKDASRYGMIHADLIRDNVINDGGRLQAIDFDDSGFGWYLFELATVLCAALDQHDYPSARDELLAGYRSVRSLPDADIAWMPLFMFLRAATYVGWLQTRSETQTAREMGAKHIARCCRLAEEYLERETMLEGRGMPS